MNPSTNQKYSEIFHIHTSPQMEDLFFMKTNILEIHYNWLTTASALSKDLEEFSNFIKIQASLSIILTLYTCTFRFQQHSLKQEVMWTWSSRVPMTIWLKTEPLDDRNWKKSTILNSFSIKCFKIKNWLQSKMKKTEFSNAFFRPMEWYSYLDLLHEINYIWSWI